MSVRSPLATEGVVMTSETIACVVCGRPVAPQAAQFANAWERSRKKSPCCSDGCAKAFDPDVHWIPAVLPKVVEGDEASELRQMARKRLASLSEARPVVRELLIAGLAPETLRFCVEESNAATAAAKSSATKKTLLGFVTGRIFGVRGVVPESRDQRSAKSYDDARADLAQWAAVVRQREHSESH
jgi:hypothetical protein